MFFFVQIPLINEHLFCEYYVRLSVGNATKGFATYGCCHPCLYVIVLVKIDIHNTCACAMCFHFLQISAKFLISQSTKY